MLNQTVTVPVTDLPATATAVSINLTGAYAEGTTFMSVFPSTYAGTSNLNLDTHVPTAAVGTVVPIGGSGNNRYIKLRNDTAKAYGIIDLVGYFDTGAVGSLYNPITPTRLLNTRDGPGQQAALANNGSVTLTPATLTPAVPAGATAVAINLTAVGTKTGTGDLAAYPAGQSAPATSTLNYAKYHRANVAIVGLNASGSFTVLNRGQGTHVVVDLLGYFTAASGQSYVALPAPVRIADTATGNGGRLGPLGANGVLPLYTNGIFSVPSSAGALMLGVIGLSTNSGYLVVYPDGVAKPPSSNVNYEPGIRVPNGVLATTGNHIVDISASTANTRVVVDLFGYFI